MTERDLAAAVASAGGRVYVVGGFVRDSLRGVAANDKDYAVCGLTAQQFESLFACAKLVGRAFPVYMVTVGGQPCEVALARADRKVGLGYRGFTISCDPGIRIEDDLFRRDTTMNALAIDVASGALIDPYGGAADIAAKVIRPVSDHFGEDPVRALRAARQSAQTGFALAGEAITAMRQCRDEILREPAERLLRELNLALATDRPSVFFRALLRADLLAATFPEIAALIGQTQSPEYHPEGDAFEHTMKVLDEVAADSVDVVTRFAALAHDLGKGATPPEMLPHHYQHETRGLDVLAAWDARMALPRPWKSAAEFVIREHMRALTVRKPRKVVELLLAFARPRIALREFCLIVRADGDYGARPLPPFLEHGDELLPLLLAVSGNDCPSTLTGAQVGDWLLEQRVRVCRDWCRQRLTDLPTTVTLCRHPNSLRISKGDAEP